MFDEQASSNINETLGSFLERCRDVEHLRIRKFSDEDLPEELILFGIADGIEENFNGFIAKSKNNKYVLTKGEIVQLINSISLTESPLYSTDSHSVKLTATFKEDHLRVFGKMAFNCLAYHNGTDFVKTDNFNKIREWIAYGGENEFVQFNLDNQNPFDAYGIKLLNLEHLIWISSAESSLVAYINLWGKPTVTVKLCDYSDKKSGLEVWFVIGKIGKI